MALTIAIAVVAFVSMEPVTAAVHRWVMHGVGEILHRSHHRARHGALEANDWYPVGFAALTMLGFVIGLNSQASTLVPVCVGITAYGAIYAIVHDGYIHRRLPWIRTWPQRRPIAALEFLAAAHRIHHQRGAAPYGMLLPVVPGRSLLRRPLRRIHAARA